MRMLEYLFMMLQGLDPQIYAPDGKLTLVIPLVVYTGPRRWNITNNTTDLYHAIGTTPIHQVLGNLIYLPIDLGAMMSDDLRDGGLMSCLIRQHNAVSASEVWSVLTDVFRMLRKIEPSQHRIRRGFYEHARQLTVLRHDDQIPSLEDFERQVLAGGKDMKTLSEVNADRWHRQVQKEGQKNLLRNLTAKRFGLGTAGKLARRIRDINNPARLTEIGEWLFECETGEEFIDRVQHQRGLPPKKAGAHS